MSKLMYLVLSLLISSLICSSSSDTVNYLLYQKDSDVPIPINIENATSILDQTASFKIIIHGWLDNGQLKWIQVMAAALHKVGNFNVIAADWRQLAGGDYVSASFITKTIGTYIGNFLLTLQIPLENVHLLGHSLGAQVCGSIAETVGKGRIGRTTGLDPAAPLFEYPSPFVYGWKLTKDAAVFVDVIHTEVLLRGLVAPCGNADFYVNKGGPQPDCMNGDRVSCSHQMVHAYYTMTIENPTRFLGIKSENCVTSDCDIAYMGYWVRTNATGAYFVTTNATGFDPYTYKYST